MSSQPPSTPEAREDVLQQAQKRLSDLHRQQQATPRAVTFVTPASVLGVLLTFTAIGVGWSHAFYWMWDRWFPLMNLAPNLPLSQKLTGGDSYYSHGPLVPLIALVIAAFIHRRVGLPVERTVSASIIGGLLLTVSCLAHLASVFARVDFISGFSLLGVVGSLLLLWGGWPMLRAYWLIPVLLFFMVPLPMEWIFNLNFKLKFFAGHWAAAIADRVFKVNTVLNGSHVILAEGPDGQPRTMVIENVCGGLRSLISLTFFASLFALVCRVKGFWRFFMLLLAVPAALLCNIARITSLILVANAYGTAAAGEGAPFHDISGLLMFALALALFFGIERVIIALSHLLKREWVDDRLLGFLSHLRIPQPAPLQTLRPGLLGFMTIVAALSLFYARETVALNRSQEARKIQQDLVINGVKFESHDYELDENSLRILETQDYLYRVFGDRASNQRVELCIVFSKDNRKGTHPPDVCLEGEGQTIDHKSQQTVSFDRRKTGGGTSTIVLRELTAAGAFHRTYYLYVYKCGDSYTSNFLVQQATIVFNGLLGRNTSGALIRFSSPIVQGNVDAARKLTLEAVRQLMPEVDLKLP